MQPANTALLREPSLPVLFLALPWRNFGSAASGTKTRPLLQSEEAFRELYAARRKAYAEGTVLVDTKDAR